MNKEKNCSWHFGEHSGRAEGVSNAMTQNFKEKPYRSLVRESIQNSLDVVDDKTKPVRVEFSFEKLKRMEFGNFFKLGEHIKGCKEYYPNDKKAVAYYSDMLSNIPNDYYSILDYIRVSDYNTKGMEYIDDYHTNLGFFAFIRAAGVSAKEEDFSGGSYGFGKAAYYQISPLSSIIVSTMTKTGKYFFEGAAALCTHLLGRDIKAAVGYYDNNNGNPVTDIEQIPECFQRTEPGSDIYIMGMRWRRTKDDVEKEIIEEVLKNFWLAILRNKLVVQVQETVIDTDTLDDLMSQYFPDMVDTTKHTVQYNPRPYYDAVVKADADASHRQFKTMLPTVGEVEFYALVDRSANDKILYLRNLNMVVYGKRMQSSGNVYGVFVCEDKSGNKILRQLEDPSHSQWKASNWKDDRNRTVTKGQDAISEINDFIKQCIDNIFKVDDADESEITGLEDYLYIQPEDEETGAAQPADSSQTNPYTGLPTGEYDNQGTSITTIVTTITEPQYDTPKSQGVVHILGGSGSTGTTTRGPRDDGSETAVTGVHQREKGKKKKKGTGNSAGRTQAEVPVGDNAAGESWKEWLPVRFRVAGQIENGKNVYNIIIYCDRAVEQGEIELLLSGEQSDIEPQLSWSDKGSVNGNLISNLSFVEGKNTIKVRFTENNVCSIKLSAYENH